MKVMTRRCKKKERKKEKNNHIIIRIKKNIHRLYSDKAHPPISAKVHISHPMLSLTKFEKGIEQFFVLQKTGCALRQGRNGGRQRERGGASTSEGSIRQ